MTFLEKLNEGVQEKETLLCVGLDSDIEEIPKTFRSGKNPQFTFNKAIIDATFPYVCAYKPNIAFYEARGPKGLDELKMTMEYLQGEHPDIPVICDAKRGDIGSTNKGYITGIFDYFGFDAITLHPIMGRESLQPFLDRKEKGCIILCKTSNPGSGEFQDQLIEGKPLWHFIASQVSREWNTNGNCMLVVGATYPQELGEIRNIAGDMTFLVPGIGAQGGDLEETVAYGLNREKKGLVINSSRGIIFSQNPGEEAKKLRDEIEKYRNNRAEKRKRNMQ